MTWVRSPTWDCFWILSAPVLGLLMLVPLAVPLPTMAITTVLLCVNFGHALAPIVLAWLHRDFRAVMLERPAKFIGVPCLVVTGGISIALGTWLLYPAFQPGGMVLEHLRVDNLGVPIVLWANLYAVWNLYHGGAQNFGFLCLYRRRGWQNRRLRFVVLAACVAAAVLVIHEIPRFLGLPIVTLFCIGLFTVNHWFASIGISAHVHAQHYGRSPLWFAAGVIVAGGLLVWAFYAALSASLHVAIFALCLRGSLGIWHFLQDRWIWKLSDPQVRATIGRDLFAHAS